MSNQLICWKCGQDASEHPQPLSTYAECSTCGTYLHCCRTCSHWNPKLRITCEETRAEEVKDREAANFCQWFTPTPKVQKPQTVDSETQSARDQLNKLFSNDSSERNVSNSETNTHEELEQLFSGTSSKDKSNNSAT
ncbi:MAG: hypothetical protein CL398_06425 [Acidiferrobacteraceae bacterium]|nr:hypothetical protein [Acidiferrobacteraceae bacterium]